MELNQVTIPALNVAASVAFYRSMGFDLMRRVAQIDITRCPHCAG